MRHDDRGSGVAFVCDERSGRRTTFSAALHERCPIAGSEPFGQQCRECDGVRAAVRVRRRDSSARCQQRSHEQLRLGVCAERRGQRDRDTGRCGCRLGDRTGRSRGDWTMTRSQIAMLGVAFAVSLGLGVSVQSGSAASLNIGTQNLTPYRTCIVTATPSTTTRVVDAVVRQATPTTALGTATTFEVSSASAANRRAYLKFDLTGCSPSIPSNATIRAATLRLYASAVPAACRTLDIFRVTARLPKSTITWNNQPFGTTLNNPASGSRTDSFDVGSSPAA